MEYGNLKMTSWHNHLEILQMLVGERENGPAPEFVMEVTDKTRADVKVKFWVCTKTTIVYMEK